MALKRQILRRWLWGLGVLALVLLAIWQLERLATLVLLSFLLAYVLNPLVTRLAKLRFLGRTSATLITLLGLLIGFLAVLFVIIPELVTEARQFFAALPSMGERFLATSIPWIERHLGVNIPQSWGGAFDEIRDRLESRGSEIIGPATQVVGGIVARTFSAFAAFVATLMFPLFLFFLLKDFPRIIEVIDGLVPLRNREGARQLGRDIDHNLSAYLHGQFTVMLVLGTLYSIGYSIVGIPLALGAGLLTGLLCFVPYVGAAAGFILALLLAALEMKGIGPVIGVGVVFGVVQLLDAVLITPRILGGKLGLDPLWIIIALMAGGELFGFLGVLLAVPTTAVLKILVKHTVDTYRSSPVYLAQADPAGQEPVAPPEEEPQPPPEESDDSEKDE